MIGNSRNRHKEQESWFAWHDSSKEKVVWSQQEPTSLDTHETMIYFYSGYKWASGYTIRWGCNRLAGTLQPNPENAFPTASFYTQFDPALLSEIPDLAQAIQHDSSGAVFHKDPSTQSWELAGIMFNISKLQNQPSETSIFSKHTRTYSVNLPTYKNEILAIMASH